MTELSAMFVSHRFLPKFVALLAVGAAAVAALPSPAQAWWLRGGYWGPRVVVGPPVLVAPPPVVYARPRPAFWVPAHWDRFGYWHRGHWA